MKVLDLELWIEIYEKVTTADMFCNIYSKPK